jgi:NAD(P)-dependent dehydrogenase (short-subunit alcohol dehydrogenase family)
VAEVVAFLATSEGTFLQGHNLVIDGGYIVQ